jgi:hypothetical protein
MFTRNSWYSKYLYAPKYQLNQRTYLRMPAPIKGSGKVSESSPTQGSSAITDTKPKAFDEKGAIGKQFTGT